MGREWKVSEGRESRNAQIQTIRRQYTASCFNSHRHKRLEYTNGLHTEVQRNVSCYANIRSGLRIKAVHSIYLLIAKTAFLA